MSIRILIVEDEPAIARNLAMMLQAKDYKIIGIAYNLLEAQDKLAQGETDLALLDINLGANLDGIEIGKLLHQKYHIPFIYITSYADDQVLAAAKITQPAGYIVKPFEERDVYAAIEIAWYNAQNSARSTLGLDAINAKIIEPLTNKEFEILQDLITGMPYAQIATEHYISINTVNSHIKKIYAKLGVRNKVEALQLCMTG